MSGKLILIYIYNFHVLSNLLLIFICKLHLNLYLIRILEVLQRQFPHWVGDVRGLGLFLGNKRIFSNNVIASFKLCHTMYTCTYENSKGVEFVKPSIELSKSPIDMVNSFFVYIRNFHVLHHLLLNYICKLHWNLNTMFVCQVNYF